MQRTDAIAEENENEEEKEKENAAPTEFVGFVSASSLLDEHENEQNGSSANGDGSGSSGIHSAQTFARHGTPIAAIARAANALVLSSGPRDDGELRSVGALGKGSAQRKTDHAHDAKVYATDECDHEDTRLEALGLVTGPDGRLVPVALSGDGEEKADDGLVRRTHKRARDDGSGKSSSASEHSPPPPPDAKWSIGISAACFLVRLSVCLFVSMSVCMSHCGRV